ncbi:Rnf-Nqr domain containing protein [Amphritea sp. HPY]|uniref:Rnf-Nqr domain containing protein n=1 Tax=Amphritea sp. HPY TaxID=3421652 RepID=UPI003D7CB609
MSTYSQIIRDGLWHNNIVFGQLLALCPLLAVTSTATNGLGLRIGLASTAVVIPVSPSIANDPDNIPVNGASS